MLPLKEKEEALSCVITMVDTQGNKYSSQLMPIVPTADEPTEKDESPKVVPTVSVSYPFGSEQAQMIFENDDLSLELISLRHADYADQVEVTLQAHNKSSREMDLNVGNSVVDGWYMYGSSAFSQISKTRRGGYDFLGYLHHARLHIFQHAGLPNPAGQRDFGDGRL